MVWNFWTTSKGLCSWLCLRANVEPVEGGRFELFWNPDESNPTSNSTVGCRVLEVKPERKIRFTWRGSDDVADVMNVPGAPVTQITVELHQDSNGTQMQIIHEGWGDGPAWERARGWFGAAWENALLALHEQLSFK